MSWWTDLLGTVSTTFKIGLGKATLDASAVSGKTFTLPDRAGTFALEDVAPVQASENLAAGDYVNIWSSSGNFRARKADATAAGKEAMGYVLAAVTSGQNATVYFEGSNTQVSGQTPGAVFLSTTAGLGTATAPSGSGNVVQRLGYATAATSVNFNAAQPVVLA